MPEQIKLTWDVEDTATYFRHRVSLGDVHGEWVTYGAIATLEIGGRLYVAVTQCFDGSLPTQRVLLISEA